MTLFIQFFFKEISHYFVSNQWRFFSIQQIGVKHDSYSCPTLSGLPIKNIACSGFIFTEYL